MLGHFVPLRKNLMFHQVPIEIQRIRHHKYPSRWYNIHVTSLGSLNHFWSASYRLKRTNHSISTISGTFLFNIIRCTNITTLVQMDLLGSLLHGISSFAVSNLSRGTNILTKFISLMPVDNSIQIFEYLGYLSLVFIFVLLVMIYPLKEYIRNTVGSLYSYVYGLALTLILYLWPLYSFIN